MPKCRLFLQLPAGIGPAAGEELVAAALGGGDVASLLVSWGPQQLEVARRVKTLSHAHDVALLLEADGAAARSLGADGVQIAPDEEAYASARALLGPAAVIGVDCGASRHLAMTLGEAGADYIGFSGLTRAPEGASLLAWWSELFELPCVALDPSSEEEAEVLAAQGADFIRPADNMWRDKTAAAEAVRSYNARLGNL